MRVDRLGSDGMLIASMRSKSVGSGRRLFDVRGMEWEEGAGDPGV